MVLGKEEAFSCHGEVMQLCAECSLGTVACRGARHITYMSDPHSQLNKKRELEGQIADLKTDLVPLDKQLEDMLATSRRQTNTLMWLGTLGCTWCGSVAVSTTVHVRGGGVCVMLGIDVRWRLSLSVCG